MPVNASRTIVKGVGEGATNPVATVFNAVYNAVGIRIFTMPITPEKILEGLHQQNK